MPEGFMDRVRNAGRGLLGTWVKIPAFETVELLAHAGFDFVVIDMEHSPLALDRVYELIFAAQRMSMAALVRLPDQLGTPVQPLLDAAPTGCSCRASPAPKARRRLPHGWSFCPGRGARPGLHFARRRWALMPLRDYLQHGDEQCLRMIQLEDRATLAAAAQFAALKHVNGLFVGLGDLFLSSGRPANSPEVQALVGSVLKATQDAGILSGIAAGTPAEARQYLDLGYSLVMVSNDARCSARPRRSWCVPLVKEVADGHGGLEANRKLCSSACASRHSCTDYRHDVDRNWGRNAAAYYTEDAVFGGEAATYTGRAEIAAFYQYPHRSWRRARGGACGEQFPGQLEGCDRALSTWYLLPMRPTASRYCPRIRPSSSRWSAISTGASPTGAGCARIAISTCCSRAEPGPPISRWTSPREVLRPRRLPGCLADGSARGIGLDAGNAASRAIDM